MKCIVDKIYTMTAIRSSNDFVRPILRLCNSAVSSAQCCMRCKTLMQKALVIAYFKVLSSWQPRQTVRLSEYAQSLSNLPVSPSECYTSVMCTTVWKQYKSISIQSLWAHIDIFVNCNWVDSRWQQYNRHLHTNKTQNNTMKMNTQNRTYVTIRICKLTKEYIT
jgi:hypothetical protein